MALRARNGFLRHCLTGYYDVCERLMVVITAVPIPKRPGRYAAKLGETVLVSSTRQPFLDGCRALLATGHSPDTIAVMRHAGSSTDSLRGPIRAAAKLTVRETDDRGPLFETYVPLDDDQKAQLRASPPRTIAQTASGVG
jgi:hypothetical protein